MSPDKLSETISKWLAWVAGAIILFVCAVPISIDVISRYFIGYTVLESFEISGYGLAASIGLGMGYTVSTKGNIRVDFLTNKLPLKIRMILDLVAAIALAVVAIALAYYAIGTLSQSWRIGARSISTLQVPLYLPQGVWGFGLFWFAIAATLAPISALIHLLRGNAAQYHQLLSSSDLNEELSQSGHDLPAEKHDLPAEKPDGANHD